MVMAHRDPAPFRASVAHPEVVRASEEDPDATSGAEAGQRFYGFDEDISGVAVPANLPILPLRGVVTFPSALVPLLISRVDSLTLVEDCLAGDRMLGLAAQKNPEEESP